MNEEARTVVIDLLDALPDVAMIAFNRYLDVVGATRTAQALHAIHRPGTNIARFTFLGGQTNPDLDDWGQKVDMIAAALRSSLRRHSEDGEFLSLLGDLIAASETFSQSWARDAVHPLHAKVLIRHEHVGLLRLDQRQLVLGGGSEDTLLVWTGADDESMSKLARISGSQGGRRR